MTTHGGGWTLAAHIASTASTHANDTRAVAAIGSADSRIYDTPGLVAERPAYGAKMSDTMIGALNSEGQYWFECAAKDFLVGTESGRFSSLYGNDEDWTIFADLDLDSDDDCDSPITTYVFSIVPSMGCPGSHGDIHYALAGGCYSEGWGNPGSLWAR
jgi:hypothetical protein